MLLPPVVGGAAATAANRPRVRQPVVVVRRGNAAVLLGVAMAKSDIWVFFGKLSAGFVGEGCPEHLRCFLDLSVVWPTKTTAGGGGDSRPMYTWEKAQTNPQIAGRLHGDVKLAAPLFPRQPSTLSKNSGLPLLLPFDELMTKMPPLRPAAAPFGSRPRCLPLWLFLLLLLLLLLLPLLLFLSLPVLWLSCCLWVLPVLLLQWLVSPCATGAVPPAAPTRLG